MIQQGIYVLKKLLLSVVSVFALNASAAPVMGSTVRYQYYYPDLSSPQLSQAEGNHVVGTDVEIPDYFGFSGRSIDITATQLVVDFSNGVFNWEDSSPGFSASPFNGFVITDVFGQIDAFSSVSVDSTSSMVGFDASRLSFGDDFISVNWQGLYYTADTFLILNISTTPASIPEPGSLALLALGLAGVALARKRKV